MPARTKAGDSFRLSANLSNDGYAGVIKQRPLFLVFDNGHERYDVELTDIDVRTWLSGLVQLDAPAVQLPSNMVQGTYTVALWLPDAAHNLRSNPAYSIRFANTDVWDAAKGYNVLTRSLLIAE